MLRYAESVGLEMLQQQRNAENAEAKIYAGRGEKEPVRDHYLMVQLNLSPLDVFLAYLPPTLTTYW